MKKPSLLLLLASALAILSCTKEPSQEGGSDPEPDTDKTVAVTGIALDKTALALTEGESAMLSATILPANADDQTVTWTSTDAAVATVADGTVTAVKAGSAKITVTTHDGNKTATCDVTVEAKPVETPTSFLTFTTASGTNSISFVKNGGNDPYFEYSYDKTAWTKWGYFTTLEFSDSKPLYIRGKNENGVSSSTTKYTNFKFAGDAPVKCDGSVMSLISYESDLTAVPGNCCFYALFYGCTCLQSAPELPATTLSAACYSSMFIGCCGLTSAPALPAKTMAESCYADMFRLCTGLKAAPELPATELAPMCYGGMFNGCSALTAAPVLSATELSSMCYYSMFCNCTGLTIAPTLPATTLASACYSGMFSGCTGIEKAPDLPAKTLVGTCYDSMFSGCSKLAYVKMLATSVSAYNCLHNWLNNVAATGTFVCSASAAWDISAAGLPTGWTVVTE